MKGRVLIIAGSDSGGGAGIQADIKTVTALGGYAATAVTAITVQDTKGVHAVHPVPDEIIREQIRVVLEDIGADCIKIGMIGSAGSGRAILNALKPWPDIPLVLDPVLVATSGDSLGDSDVAELLRTEFLGRASVVTPNLPELEALTGQNAMQDPVGAARSLIGMGAKAVLAKGGHGEGDLLLDQLVTAEQVYRYENPRIETRHTHGTGCSLASALATGIAQGLTLPEACERAVAAVHAAIAAAPGLGQGHGPIGHLAMSSWKRD
ncbi:bifunctional hydroxymethylpyrimidine kinase/phosphomethylpyrimidine kinase [Parvularcula sp. ZS-1/3]|uniref:hydroxymethylpyrimidine kinase n=1 Tax=Parvularcula mediterranea TaxID=2732508 RepID=A0A7Y3W6A6_9PROT|nr:bifunctional hydroxymethylpyrimidine kinase/phosphomethylpyrimidine kinase [Parvularcula mediterranea]NNU17333.1 bifunctional hydroxymethylpyrimidine kinase/phosphomethylpyrimidine kinase [Parvularcula mediterranea]